MTLLSDDPRIKKTLSQIDNALLENLTQYPFHRITVDKLCKSAQINRTTFYKYYADKYALLDDYLARVLKDFREHTNTAFILSDEDSIGDLAYMEDFLIYTQYFDAHKKSFEILWNAEFERHIFDEMTEIIHNRILEPLYENDKITPDNYKFANLYASLFSSNLMNLISWWISNQDTVLVGTVNSIMAQNINDGMFKTFRKYIS